MRIRLLKTGKNSAFYNMGLDQALMEGVAKGEPAVLRFYGWTPAAVSIGYFQKLIDEIDVFQCEKNGIDVVRRITGGGAVFHDDELTYSFIIPVQNSLLRKPILESYEDITKGIIEGGNELGLDIRFVPLNDLVIDGKKISGNAQTRRGGVILQHGTILLNVDVDKMFSLLKVPNEKIRDKMINDVRNRVTSISTFLKRKIDFVEAQQIFEEGFKKAFNEVEFDMSGVTIEEAMLANQYAYEKYDSKEFKFNL